MKKLIPHMVVVLMFVLAGCSGEAYIDVTNETDAQISISVNDQPNEVVAAGDTSDTYTLKVVNGLVNYVSVEATGEWLRDYSVNVAIVAGDQITHQVRPNIADLTCVNGSIDSAALTLDSETLEFAGNDSMSFQFAASGSHAVSYEGRYIFEETSTENWMPGNAYRFEMLPNACELEIDNLHDDYVIYYVKFSPSTASDWGDDRLGAEEMINPGEGYVWKVEGGIQWDFQVQAGDPHPDSLVHVYEFYDYTDRAADATYIYEFPTIFSAAETETLSKSQAGKTTIKKRGSFAKSGSASDVRIEKVEKKSIGSSKHAVVVTR